MITYAPKYSLILVSMILFQICSLVDGWTEVWDDEQEVPYKYSGDQWIGFDNPRSIGLKVQLTRVQYNKILTNCDYCCRFNLQSLVIWEE
jgi:hypothetical protein